MIETLIIIALIALLAWREWRHELHVRELEGRLIDTGNPGVSIPVSGIKSVRPTPNVIMKEDENEVFLTDMAHMDIPKEYKIQMEGDSETPAEARARGEK